MIRTHEIEQMCVVAKGPNHGPVPLLSCMRPTPLDRG